MRRVLAVTLFALMPWVAQARVNTAEGRVQQTAPAALDAQRISSYRSGPNSADLSVQENNAASDFDKQKQAVKEQANASPGTETFRAPTTTMSARASYFRIYDTDSILRTDRDGDGYHSEFRIRFDADVSTGDALVYAKLYLRRVGDTGSWQLYHTTGNFWIYGQSGTDDYFVDTTLDDGFPTAEYDVLIDLYETGYSGVVATLDSYDDSALAYLQLEEVGLDVPFGMSGYRINDVATSLVIDDDRDGYYSRFRVTFDPDTDSSGSYIYAVVWVRPQGGTWIREHESEDFRVDASGTADAYSFTADWISGYPTARYDVQIDLYDAATGLLVASAGSERFELSELPLEDQARDRYINPPSSGAGEYVTSYEEGGGAVSIWFGVALALLAIGRKLFAIKKLNAIVALRAPRRDQK